MSSNCIVRTGATQFDALYRDVDQYYSNKIHSHGPTAMGVDWPCALTQKLRFVQLLRICKLKRSFELNDIGCGYGALLGFLRERHGHRRIQYHGVDLCEEMIDAARTLWSTDRCSTFTVGHGAANMADYSVASGIFNVKLEQPEELWTSFVKVTINDMLANSRMGIAINFLAPLPAEADAAPQLYRPSPDEWVHYCEHQLGAITDVISNYGIREFTLLARRAQ